MAQNAPGIPTADLCHDLFEDRGLWVQNESKLIEENNNEEEVKAKAQAKDKEAGSVSQEVVCNDNPSDGGANEGKRHYLEELLVPDHVVLSKIAKNEELNKASIVFLLAA